MLSPLSKPYETIKLKKDQTTTWLILDRPHKLNSITATMLEELSEALDTIEKDATIRCIIVTGEGKKAFSTGADITELRNLTPETAAKFSRKGQRVFSKLEALSKPVVAAINGYALGGGLELALACDFRLASNQAELGCPEIKLGMIPAWGGTQRLPCLVGLSNAKRLIMLGDRVKADEALRMGLVDKVVSLENLGNEVEALAQRLSESSPTALKHAKQSINFGIQPYLESGLKKETSFFTLLFSRKETKEKIKAFMSQINPKVGDR